jgi:hypothetical protein
MIFRLQRFLYTYFLLYPSWTTGGDIFRFLDNLCGISGDHKTLALFDVSLDA